MNSRPSAPNAGYELSLAVSESAPAAKDADTRALERRLTDALGLDVTIDHKGERGSVTISYTDLDQLDAVIRKLGG